MAITSGAIKVLITEAKRKPFSGSLLTLGRQSVFVSQSAFHKIAEDLAFPLSSIPQSDKRPLNDSGIGDDVLFRSLGFDQVVTTDNDDFESADVIFDLNSSGPPPELLNRFDVILDCGTLEHIFDLPNALNNICRMLKTGGRVIHISPSSNHIDHGFYMFSPTLFFDFYSANHFEINTIQVIRYTQIHDLCPRLSPWLAMDCKPGSLGYFAIGGLDDGAYSVHVVTTKTEQSTGNTIPQQGYFVRAWSGATPALSRLSIFFSRHPRLKAIVKTIYIALKPKRKAPLNVVARY